MLFHASGIKLFNVLLNHSAGRKPGSRTFYGFFHQMNPFVGDAVAGHLVIQRYDFLFEGVVDFSGIAGVRIG
jgi:hypothetical protein